MRSLGFNFEEGLFVHLLREAGYLDLGVAVQKDAGAERYMIYTLSLALHYPLHGAGRSFWPP